MTRGRSNPLSELAKLGFENLSETVSKLDRLVELVGDWGHSALTPLASAASPDRALDFLLRMAEIQPKAVSKTLSDSSMAERFCRITGASDGIAEHLLRHPQSFKLPKKPELGKNYKVAPSSRKDLRVSYRDSLLRIMDWDLSQKDPAAAYRDVSMALTELTDETLKSAIEVAIAELMAEGRLKPENVEPLPLAVIAMGKTGARELNYVSDVDVIYAATSTESVDVATKIATRMQQVIDAVEVEPGLWQVDPNLRPEGKSGALVRTLEAHTAYYQKWAEPWEFQALLQARPLAGDRALGEAYRTALDPMIWQASSRPGFVEQVQRMRERVTDNIPADQVDYQIKLGPGGLRDIEFTIQLLQVVHGAQDESVRALDTLGALQALSRAGYVGRPEAAEFDHAYRTLRVLEHRIQLGALKRSHVMPRDEEVLRVLARHTKLADTADDLVEHWRGIQRSVRSLHERLFYRPLLSAVAGLEEPGVELTSEQAALRLQASGFRNPEGALHHIGALTQGVSRRAAIHRTLLPVLLKWLSDGTDPDGGLLAFRQLSDDLGESNWFLRMLRDSSGAAQRLMTVLGTSAFVAKLFGRVPDGAAWLDNDDDLKPRERDSLREEITATLERHQDSEESARKALRAVRRRELLRIALSSMLGVSDITEVGQALTDLSQAFLEGILTLAREKNDGVEFAIIAMGRLGGSELSFGSDLDVIYVFRDAGAGDEAHGVAERIVKDITRLSEDVLFPVDLDAGLRPEGKNGPIVRSLDAYAAYYERWALGWEAQALLRAAPYVGDVSLTEDFLAMAAPFRYPDAFHHDEVREIRRIKARVEAERLPQGADASRHLKLGRGSLSDVEWAVQLLQLQHGHAHPDIRTASTLQALEAIEAHSLLSASDIAQLKEAWLLASRIRTALALFGEPSTDVLPSDRAGLEGAARLMGFPPRSASALEETYLRITRRSRSVFERVFYGTEG